eukprot:UC1_evm1s1703
MTVSDSWRFSESRVGAGGGGEAGGGMGGGTKLVSSSYIPGAVLLRHDRLRLDALLADDMNDTLGVGGGGGGGGGIGVGVGASNNHTTRIANRSETLTRAQNSAVTKNTVTTTPTCASSSSSSSSSPVLKSKESLEIPSPSSPFRLPESERKRLAELEVKIEQLAGPGGIGAAMRPTSARAGLSSRRRPHSSASREAAAVSAISSAELTSARIKDLDAEIERVRAADRYHGSSEIGNSASQRLDEKIIKELLAGGNV